MSEPTTAETPRPLYLTAASVRALGACWTDAQLRAYLHGRKRVAIRTVLLDENRYLISENDQRWLAARMLLDRGGAKLLSRWLDPLVEAAIHRGQAEVGDNCPVWTAWAERWLSGEDRSEAAAWAARAARAAAEAAAVPHREQMEAALRLMEGP